MSAHFETTSKVYFQFLLYIYVSHQKADRAFLVTSEDMFPD